MLLLRQTYEYVVANLGMSEQYASRNCQDGLYVPLLFHALKVTGDGDKVLALKDIHSTPIGTYQLNHVTCCFTT